MTAFEESRIAFTPVRSSGRLRAAIARYYFTPAAVLVVILLIVNLAVQPNFGWPEQFATFAPYALMAMASMPAVVSGGGGLDLSISPVAILCGAVYVMWLVPNGLGDAWFAIPIVLAVGTAVGVINGLIVTRLRIAPVVATLAVSFVVAGVDLLVAPNAQTVSTGWTRNIIGTTLGVPNAAVLIAIPVIIWGVLRLTTFTRTLLSVGGNDVAAYSAGIHVGRVRVLAYGFGGFLAALAGFALVGLVGSVDPSTSTSYTLPALVSIALGGIAVEGGRGGMAGPILGAAVVYLLQSVLAVLGVPQAWLQVLYGVLLAVAVLFSKVLSRAERRTE